MWRSFNQLLRTIVCGNSSGNHGFHLDYEFLWNKCLFAKSLHRRIRFFNIGFFGEVTGSTHFSSVGIILEDDFVVKHHCNCFLDMFLFSTFKLDILETAIECIFSTVYMSRKEFAFSQIYHVFDFPFQLYCHTVASHLTTLR